MNPVALFVGILLMMWAEEKRIAVGPFLFDSVECWAVVAMFIAALCVFALGCHTHGKGST